MSSLRKLLVLACLSSTFITGCSDSKTPCTPGSLDCACNAGVERCVSLGLVCIDNTCRACDTGTQGCGCFDDGTCATELMGCAAGRCGWLDAPPANPKCYSPCSADLVHGDGTTTICSGEGLMEGCVGGNECVNGTCAVPGSSAPAACMHDADCTDFQACLMGACYSTCEVNADCTAGRECFRNTCRVPCNTVTNPCAETDRVCKTYDGESGYCMPALPVTGPGVVHDLGSFTLLPKTLAFSNVHVRASYFITNNSTTPQDFVIHKARHTEYTSTGLVQVDDTTGQPLFWLTLTDCVLDSATGDCAVRLEAGEEKALSIAGAANPTRPRWDGVITVTNSNIGTQELRLTYVQKPDGQWSGKMYYFADFNDVGLDAWVAGTGSIGAVRNAFVQRWDQFVHGTLTFDEFVAVISSTQNGSWKWPTIKNYSGCQDAKVACYPYDNPQGYSIYTPNEPDFPIPAGMVEFPLTMNVQQSDPTSAPQNLTGKIVSDKTLHFPGDPALAMTLAGDPQSCTANAAGTVVCPLTSLQASVLIGGRYKFDGADCSTYVDGTYGLFKTPWLVPGFTDGTAFEDGELYYKECRDTTLPFGDSVDPGVNQGMAVANPVPDGATRKRQLTLVAGALINNEDLLVIFKEHFQSFMGASDTDGFSAYGLLRLRRVTAELDADAYVGNAAVDERVFSSKLQVGCSDAFLDEIKNGLNNSTRYNPDNPSDVTKLADTILTGGPVPAAARAIALPKEVHFICMDTGLIDNVPPTGNTLIPCPEGSLVRYFVLEKVSGATTVADFLAGLSCHNSFATTSNSVGYNIQVGQDGYIKGTDTFHNTVAVDVTTPGTCWTDVTDWMQTAPSGFTFRIDPPWRCTDGSLTCAANRTDLRASKTFYDEADGTSASVAFVSAQAALNDAFRYKTRFRSRSGSGLGFTPEICVPNSNAVPYCYDPTAIQQLRDRVDCAAYLYTEHYDMLSTPARKLEMEMFLKRSLAYEEQKYNASGDLLEVPIIHEGFERLNSELLIMLGDDAYTAASASRFDLAGMNLRSFEGALFEPPDGINMSGGAGFEMVKLYQATEYYQLVLDRFFSLGPTIWKSMDPAKTFPGFVMTETVTAYFDRVARASTQKSRAWSQIASRYLSFNRPDLARRVVSRAYVSTYLESIILSRVMLQLLDTVEQADKAEIKKRVELAQLGYRSALLDMQQMYDTITDDVTVFGFPPNYIPFPALDPGDTNAFDKVYASAMDLAAVAAEKEFLALDNSRTYNVDAASFQSEMVSIRNNYEDQLSALCGTFRSESGRIYPAIVKYAELEPKLRVIADPCGLVSTGSIHDALAEVELASIDLRAARMAIDDQIALIRIEEDRVKNQCLLINETAEYVFDKQQAINAIQIAVNAAEKTKEMIERIMAQVQFCAEQAKCNVIDFGAECSIAAAGLSVAVGVFAVVDVAVGVIDTGIVVGEAEIAELEAQTSRWVTQRECDYAKVDSDARVRELVLGLHSLTLQAQRSAKSVLLAKSQVESLVNEAQRLQDQQVETEQLAINVEAARNDPNVRVYKNDAVLTADRTFYRALREAYKATKVYEYYTSQSYAPLVDLFLVRMVSHGDVTLESYLDELAGNFSNFEESYGNPDLRVAVLSLRDDIFQIPRYSSDNLALTEAQRVGELRDRLRDVTLLDDRGYINISFATTLAELSPLTRNHKVSYVEAQILGSDVGDAVARIYLRQRGTGTVRGVDGEKGFYIFPERTAVINAIVGEERTFANDTVYINERLRDRPMANSHWELVLNQRDEAVNRDINLASIDDIFLYVYYTDFTEL
jgi:hypothetical protein